MTGAIRRLVGRVVDRLADVGGKIDDELAMNDKIIIRFLEVESQHLCRRR